MAHDLHIAHAVAGGIALVAGCVAIGRRTLFTIYLCSLVAMEVFLIRPYATTRLERTPYALGGKVVLVAGRDQRRHDRGRDHDSDHGQRGGDRDHPEHHVAYSSIVLAVLEFRALYFALEGLVGRFNYRHYGLAAILVFLGLKSGLQGFRVGIESTTGTESIEEMRSPARRAAESRKGIGGGSAEAWARTVSACRRRAKPLRPVATPARYGSSGVLPATEDSGGDHFTVRRD